jgi:hypothetical protein
MKYKIVSQNGECISTTYDHLPDYQENPLDIKIWRWSHFQPPDDIVTWREHPGLVEIFFITNIDEFPYNLFGKQSLRPNDYVVLRFRDKNSMLLWKLKFSLPIEH